MTLNMPYDEVVKRIVEETNLSKEEVIQRIDEKVKELGGLITLEGAAHIIARELEVNLYNSQPAQKPKPITISDLMDGMNNVSITAMIRTIYEPKVFTKKDGSQGAVQNIHLLDKSGDCRLVLWDDQIRQFNDVGLSKGDIIHIDGAYVKESKFDGIKELSLSSRSQIELNPKNVKKEAFPETLLEPPKIENIKLGQTDIELIGQISNIRPRSTFNRKDGSEGQVASLELADETGKIKVTLWDDQTDIIDVLKEGNVVTLVGGYSREGLNNSVEIHLSRNGFIEKNTKTKLSVPEEILNSQSILGSPSKKKTTPQKEVRLSDLDESLTNIAVIARITGISNIREFQRKDGSTSTVGSLMVQDTSGPGKITFWNSKTDYIKQVDIGDVIRVEGAYVRLGLRGEPEVHVGGNTNVEINPEYLKDAVPELDLDYLEIASLEPNISDVNLKALATRVQELRSFSKNDGSTGHVLNIGISDNTGSTRVVAWDEQAIELESLEEMTPIEILHGYTKEGNQGVEVHLGLLSSVRKLDKSDVPELENITPILSTTGEKSKSAERVNMINLLDGQFAEVRGTILKLYEGKMYYLSCPECRKKVEETNNGNWQCEEHGEVSPDTALLVSIALDDGTGCIKATFFRDLAEQLLDTKADEIVKELEEAGVQPVVAKFEQRIKGREIVVRGKARKNKYDDGMDIIVSSFSEADIKAEIERAKKSLNV
jgi:replication factor A1